MGAMVVYKRLLHYYWRHCMFCIFLQLFQKYFLYVFVLQKKPISLWFCSFKFMCSDLCNDIMVITQYITNRTQKKFNN